MSGLHDVTEEEELFVREVVEEVQNHMMSGGEFETDFNRLVGMHLNDIREMMTAVTPDKLKDGPLLALKVFQSFVRLGAGFALGVLLQRARDEIKDEEEGGDVQ